MKTKDILSLKLTSKKPRNPVVSAAITRKSAGPMKNKKLAVKNGDEKYPNKLIESDNQSESNFISLLLAARTHAHILHLAERSVTKHLALEELYNGIGEKLGALAEFLLGSGHDIQPKILTINFSNDPAEFVTSLFNLVNNKPIGELASNDFDELVAIITKTKYKLERLS